MSGDVEIVANFLRSKFLHASRLWVEGCVEYFKSQHQGSRFSVFDLQNFALDQWLLVDLRSMGLGCLPNDLCNRKDITINGRYAVQVEAVLDISTPAYSQMLLVRQISTENCDVSKKPPENWEPKPGRVLRLKIFDGHQEVIGMEYSPIRELDKTLTPGTKMLIIGPVRCRRGIFLLEQKNVKILGGEVDTLLIVNALENILARSLNLPENPDPYGTVETADEPVVINPPVPRTLGAETLQPRHQVSVHNSMINNQQISDPSEYPDDDELNDLEIIDVKPALQSVSNDDEQDMEQVFNDEDDDILLQLPVDDLTNDVPNEQRQPKHEKVIRRNEPSTSKSFGRSDDGNVKRDTHAQPTKLIKTSSTSSQGRITKFLQHTSASTSSGALEEGTEVLVKFSSHLSSKEVKMAPFVYLIQLVSSPQESGTYPVKGFLLTLLSTLEERRGHWYLKATLTDGSANLDVSFSEEVLDEIIGFSATEMQVLRQKMSGNPAIKEKLKLGFQQAKKKLYEMNGIFYIYFDRDNEMPMIVNIEPITLKHFALLKSRLCE